MGITVIRQGIDRRTPGRDALTIQGNDVIGFDTVQNGSGNRFQEGLGPDDDPPIPPERLEAGTAALDLVYAPGLTPWIRACRSRGLRAADGRTMLVAQGARAFERFFPGHTAPRAVMAAAVNRALEA
jgi:shikimate 5-dehydrogenase